MMNLQVFFASYELTGNQTLVDMAISHADKTMVNHIRPDGKMSMSCVEYSQLREFALVSRRIVPCRGL